MLKSGSLKIIGLVLLLLVGAFFMFSSRTRNAESAPNVSLGQMVTALELDQNGCAVEPVSEFYGDETVYVALDESFIPSGTSMFARLTYNGQPVEDTDEIVADQDMQSCVWFEFSPDSTGGFQNGNYQVQLFVNGNATDAAQFTVSNGAGPGEASSLPAFGRLYASTSVDANGCPLDDVGEFYADEPVYVSLEESFIPAGTELFARLSYEGQTVEDSDPIYADTDMNSCVWFSFEPVSSGWEPGNYQVDIYANGAPADSVRFGVR